LAGDRHLKLLAAGGHNPRERGDDQRVVALAGLGDLL
jgi:hypothetical protein